VALTGARKGLGKGESGVFIKRKLTANLMSAKKEIMIILIGMIPTRT
jgi:hypothetical protein